MAIGGLEGVVAAQTRLSEVDGERGELVIAGFLVEELAAHATFEETTWLLWHGELPSPGQPAAFRAGLAAPREMPPAGLTVVRGGAPPPPRPKGSPRGGAGAPFLRGGGGGAVLGGPP